MSDVEKYEEIIKNVFGSLERGISPADESSQDVVQSCYDYLEPYVGEIESKNSQDPE